jgi:hypothetical protein
MPSGFSFADPDAHRAAYQRQKINFRCGVVFDESCGTFEEFGAEHLDEFIARLGSANAFISQNGLAHDLTLLERVRPTSLVLELRAKPHADLMHIDRGKLPDLAQRHIPEQWIELVAEQKQREQRADELWPPQELFSGFWHREQENKQEHSLAKCRLDVAATYQIFRKLEIEQPTRIKWLSSSEE